VKRLFEFIGPDSTRASGQSEKFWEISVSDSEIRVRFGKVGANGQTTLKTLPDAPTANREAEKLIAQKLKKGYTEVTIGGASGPDVHGAALLGPSMTSKFDKTRLFGEVTTILIAQLDFFARLYSDEAFKCVEFDFGFADEEGEHYFFEEEDLDQLGNLLYDSGLDSDAQPISWEDQDDFPSGADTQVDFFGFSTLEMLTSRDLVFQYHAQVSQLKAKTPFEVRVNEFLVQNLRLIYATSECHHEFSEKSGFSINCELCVLLVWDPETLAELTDSWY